MPILIGLLFVGAGLLVLIGIYGTSILSGEIRPKLPTAAAPEVKVDEISPLAILPTQKLLDRIGLGKTLKNRLNSAYVRLHPFEFFNLKLLVAGACGVLGFFVYSQMSPLVLVGAVIGFIIPDVWLSGKIKKRQYAIVRVLPETVDLLGLCVEAGLDFTTAVRWLIDKVPGNPMIEELTFLLEEIKWGKSRNQALKDMSKRLDIPEVSSFVQTLVQAERMGTPVADAFAILSEDTRMQRFHRGERFAMQAPMKILIPLIFCILPVIGIVVGGPILIQFMTNKLF